MDNYKFNKNFINLHKEFNEECNIKKIDLLNFKSKGKMTTIVQNCPYIDGLKHMRYIEKNYNNILTDENIARWKNYDLLGGQGNQKLIKNLSPKVFSYVKEILIFYSIFLKNKNIKEIEKIMVIGGGYGMEMVLIYDILKILQINVKKIIGIDMKNVSELQNYFFKKLGLDNICESHDSTFQVDKLDFIYSNCCLAEVPPDINYQYYNNYFKKSTKSYIVWTKVFSEIPEYYKPYVSDAIEEFNLSAETNVLIIK